jgi:hypothetical protein
MLIALLCLVGLGLIAFGAYRVVAWRRVQRDYRSWPSVTGTITASSVKTVDRYDDDNQPYDVWLPVTAYRYAVAGTEHQGRRAFWFDREFEDADEAQRWLETCPVGSQRPVFYDPAHPGKSALLLNDPASTPGMAFVWVGLLLAVGAILSPAFA